MEEAQGRGFAHGGPLERAGVPLPRDDGHECFRPGGIAAAPEREWRRRSEPVRRTDQAAAVWLYSTRPKKHDLLRVATANDAAEIVAEIDSVLRDREASVPEEAPGAPTVDDILSRMSAYMEVPAAA